MVRRCGPPHGEAAKRQARQFKHYLQSNLIGYSRRWNPIIASMFNNEISTSMDFPNVHRRFGNRGPEHYTEVWERNLQQVRDAGIQVGLIALLTEATLAAGQKLFTPTL